MRALCEGVLVGAGTARRDRPQLTVRLVEGKNPKRIVLGSTAEGMENLTGSNGDPVYLLGAERRFRRKGVRAVPLKRRGNLIPAVLVLDTLFDLGVSSVFIEGGGFTASRFLDENALDVLHLHIAPIVIGSGTGSFVLSTARDIPAAVRPAVHYFLPVDDAMMLVAAFSTGRPEEKRR
jgi:riboflavin biosynthesis pyrimidine reductase